MPRGSRGMPPRKILKNRCSEIESEGISESKSMYIATYFNYCLHLLCIAIANYLNSKTLELIHCQNKIPKGGQAKAKGSKFTPAPLKETLNTVPLLNIAKTRIFHLVYNLKNF